MYEFFIRHISVEKIAVLIMAVAFVYHLVIANSEED